MTKTVGVIGGLGPAATLDFFAKLLAKTPAERDQDHLRVLIDNNPRVPDRNAALRGEGPSPGPSFADAARGLERQGANFIVLACNTAHAWQDEIEAAISVPFLSMIDATVEETVATLNANHHRSVPAKAGTQERRGETGPPLSRGPSTEGGAASVGILAADGCLLAQLYQHAFAARGINVLTLEGPQQAQFMRLVYAIKSGDVGDVVRFDMKALAWALTRRGASALVAGCTEVPLVLDAGDVEAPLISSTDVLVARTIAFARGD